MARRGFGVTVGQSLGDGQYPVSDTGSDGGTALAAAIAVLVADAEAPTEAHVTTANAAHTVFITPHVVVTYDTTAVTTMNQLKRALDAVLRRAQASGIV